MITFLFFIKRKKKNPINGSLWKISYRRFEQNIFRFFLKENKIQIKIYK